MSKKDYFCLADTETTMDDTVADFGAIICDRKGRIYASCSVLIAGVFGISPLFYIASENEENLWSKQGKDRRYDTYLEMIEQGTRQIASVAAVNRWLSKAVGMYDPILTAYNLAFDVGKCRNTKIDLTMFTRRFCLMKAAQHKWGRSKAYKNFVLTVHAFNPPTALGNMAYKTNAETMARFVLDSPDLEDEPHCALEDVIDYELPILVKLVNSTKKKVWMNPQGTSWQGVQVKDHFTAK